jgi:hypothetical protein
MLQCLLERDSLVFLFQEAENQRSYIFTVLGPFRLVVGELTFDDFADSF